MRYGRKQRPSTQVSGWLQSSRELPLTLGAVLWYDASDLSTITATQSGVSEWRDKSDSQKHLYNSTMISGQNTINGLNVLYSNGSAGYAGATSTRSTTYATVFAVIRHISQTGIIFGGATQRPFIGIFQSGSGSSSFFGMGTGTQKVNGVAVADTRGSLWTAINGKTVIYQANCNNPNMGFGTDWYPGTYADSNFTAEQDNAEFIYFNKQLTASEEGLVESYLKAKWGLSY